jgi:hypothetical protein
MLGRIGGPNVRHPARRRQRIHDAGASCAAGRRIRSALCYRAIGWGDRLRYSPRGRSGGRHVSRHQFWARLRGEPRHLASSRLLDELERYSRMTSADGEPPNASPMNKHQRTVRLGVSQSICIAACVPLVLFALVRAISVQPDTKAVAALRSGIRALQVGDYREGLTDIDRAIDLEPRSLYAQQFAHRYIVTGDSAGVESYAPKDLSAQLFNPRTLTNPRRGSRNGPSSKTLIARNRLPACYEPYSYRSRYSRGCCHFSTRLRSGSD